jgi:hypothetical protein
MKKLELLFLKMVETVLAFLNKDKTKWSEVPGMADQVTLVDNKYNKAMNSAEVIQGLDQTAYTKLKNKRFDEIIASVLIVCHRMATYALKNKDSILHQLVNHTPSSLSRGMEKEGIARCKAIIDKAATMLDVLAVYKVDKALLDANLALIDQFNTLINARTNVILDKSTGIQDITAQTEAIKDDLKILDNMVYGYITNEEFLASYKTARKVESSRSRKNTNGEEATTADATSTNAETKK